jgi:hypothetical protein
MIGHEVRVFHTARMPGVDAPRRPAPLPARCRPRGTLIDRLASRASKGSKASRNRVSDLFV